MEFPTNTGHHPLCTQLLVVSHILTTVFWYGYLPYTLWSSVTQYLFLFLWFCSPHGSVAAFNFLWTRSSVLGKSCRLHAKSRYSVCSCVGSNFLACRQMHASSLCMSTRWQGLCSHEILWSLFYSWPPWLLQSFVGSIAFYLTPAIGLEPLEFCVSVCHWQFRRPIVCSEIRNSLPVVVQCPVVNHEVSCD